MSRAIGKGDSMAVDGHLIFDTKIDESGFNVGIKKLGSIAKGGLTLLGGAVAGVAAAIGTASAAAIKVGSDFEAGMSKVSAISGATGSELQKGIAYLTLENADDLLLEKEETTYSFNVKSNQNWSAAVTEGDEWLSIQSGENGTLDGMVTLKALENKGEQRSGIVVIYDRHGKEVANVECTQKGVVLTPTTQSLRALYHTEKTLLHLFIRYITGRESHSRNFSMCTDRNNLS